MQRPSSAGHGDIVLMQRVSRYFDSFISVQALTDMNLTVRRGEVVGLLGPPGSGKTTALRILSGNLAPSEGRIRIFGRSPGSRAIRSRVGYLPEKSSDIKKTFLGKTVSLARDLIKGKATKKQNSQSATDHSRQIHLAKILLKNPELLILDEPFAMPSPSAIEEIKELILGQAAKGKTVILSGDSLCHAKDVCSHLALCYHGKIEAMGTLDDLLATPTNIRALSALLPSLSADRVLAMLREEFKQTEMQRAVSNARSNETPQSVHSPNAKDSSSRLETDNKTLAQLLRSASDFAAPPTQAHSQGESNQVLDALVKSQDSDSSLNAVEVSKSSNDSTTGNVKSDPAD